MIPNSRVFFSAFHVIRVLKGFSAIMLLALIAPVVQAQTYPPGFSETTVFSGLTFPTVVRFSPDGRVFVGEKSGRIKIFTSLSDTTPDIINALEGSVHDFWDRGLLGMALHPDFPNTPYVYVLYTLNHDKFNDVDGPPPTGTPSWSDSCPSPPGATGDGCVVDGRLARIEISPSNTLVGNELAILEDKWCQQFPSHSIGGLAFGPGGELYVTAGDGASFGTTDWGQLGGTQGGGFPTPSNPCADPPSNTRGIPPASAAVGEGGALRSQDLRTPADPVSLDGAVLRIIPDTGDPWPTNPLIGGDPDDDRIIGYGLRNPFRVAVRPGTSEVWIGDVGWSSFEEVNRITNFGVVHNFGWPCYEGPILAEGNFNRVFRWNGAFSNLTSAANDAAAGDVPMDAGVDTAIYYGTNAVQKFYGLKISLQSNPSSGTRVFEYWNGSAWTLFTPIVIQGDINLTSGLTHEYSWQTLVNWTPTSVDGINGFYIRHRVTSTHDSAPVGNQMRAMVPRTTSYSGVGICSNLYSEGPPSVTAPFIAYSHGADVDPDGDACPPPTPPGGSSISGLAFYGLGTYPAEYQNALFFSDYSRKCIYVAQADGNGEIDASTRTAFGVNPGGPVFLEVGPGGDLYYAGFDTGRITRIRFNTGGNTLPTALAQATPSFGNPPLLVQFDGSGSTDPDPGATLFYQWDLDGDGQYDDSNIVNPSTTYPDTGSTYTVTVGLKVTDDLGGIDTDDIVITVGNTAPSATITAPSSALTWQVGDDISFSATATDLQDGNMPPSSMTWNIIMHHCPGGQGNCHQHIVETRNGVSGGTFNAPDHEWYAFIEFKLTVTDSGGLTDIESVSIQPQTVNFNFNSVPSGLTLSVGGTTDTTPFTRPAIIGSLNSVSAPSPQSLSGTLYRWVSWSDGGAQSHAVLAESTPQTLTATYVACLSVDTTCDGVDQDCDGTPDDDYLPVPTSCGIGACESTGITSCVNGEVQDSCSPGTPAPSDETCDGIDNNCNGVDDEEYIPVNTDCGIGACFSTGVTSCVAGDVQDSCTPGTPAPNDATCDAVDDDCNGQEDEDYISIITECGIGACLESGATSCVDGDELDSCTPGTPAPNDATCDAVDDNCNGQEDEDYMPVPTTCGVGACSSTGVTSCGSGQEQNSCIPGIPAEDDSVCNGIDDDCDGATDEEIAPLQISPLNASFGPEGGSGQINVDAPEGNCLWTAVSTQPWLTITSGSSGTADGVINYSVTSYTNTVVRTGIVEVNELDFNVTQGPMIFYDDFEDSDVADWLKVKGDWTVVSGDLVGRISRKGEIHSPDFGKCSTCTFETDVVMETAGSRVSILAWFIDKKNHIEVRLMEDKNRVLVRQKVGGVNIRKFKSLQTLDPNILYNVRATFDGTVIRVLLNNQEIISGSLAGIPEGNVAFRVKSIQGTATSRFAVIKVQ